MDAHYIQTQSLSVGYDGNALIHDICLDIRKGEIVVLVGPNGSGKSTILKSITRHLELIGGKVTLEGKDMGLSTYAELSKKMAVVLTERIRPELMTCYDVAAMGRYPYTGRLGRLSDTDKEKVERALEIVRAETIAEKDFLSISDGQRQRILLARALCQEPELLVLDEPTSFLDIRYKIELLQVLRRMAAEEKITVILSLHEIDLAQKFADKVVCVKGDRIACCGTPEEVCTEDRIRELYELGDGYYDAVFGSLELPKVDGVPKAVVIANGGSGTPVYRKLQRQGVPFVAGILSCNDADYRIAKKLAAVVIEEKPFEPVSDETIAKMKGAIDACEYVIVADVMTGSGNSRIGEIIDYAKALGKVANVDS